MHTQRIILLVAAAAGVISAFMEWLSFSFFGFSGMDIGEGWIPCAIFGAVAGAGLFGPWKARPPAVPAAIGAVLAAGGIGFAIWTYIRAGRGELDIAGTGGGELGDPRMLEAMKKVFEPGLGLYVMMGAGAVAHELVGAQRAAGVLAELAAAIVDVRRRQLARIAVRVQDVRVKADDRILHHVVRHEVEEVLVVRIVLRQDAEDDEAAILVLLGDAGQVRDLGEAGLAPRGPEVHEDDLALERLPRVGLADRVDEGDVRQAVALADAARLRGRGAAASERGEQEDHEAGDAREQDADQRFGGGGHRNLSSEGSRSSGGTKPRSSSTVAVTLAMPAVPARSGSIS
jgi:hypothetical protein